MSETFQTLTLACDARGVATLTLARPEVHNAFDETVIAELQRAAERLAADPGVRVVVLTGEGRSFSAGGDLRWFRRQVDSGREERIAGSRALGSMLRTLDELPRPLVGRINGGAYGGGTGLISVCDIAIGVEGARFGLTEVRLGLLPANISPFVVRRLGAGNCRRVMLSGRTFGAGEAVQLGLLAAAVPAEALDAAVEAEVAELLQAAPGAAAATKRLIRYVEGHDLEASLDYSARALADGWESAEGQEGIAAFLAKRTPSWRGE
ncbi:MAG: crotonase/enoyl-CoA hydratase family protein [Tistlia sp.]|uniref:crotonase/enoyl-CoA hydratase family protein n=1 Tax=Tistlia sp. TaxID=3057121 RepID=UPI0034A1FC47